MCRSQIIKESRGRFDDEICFSNAEPQEIEGNERYSGRARRGGRVGGRPRRKDRGGGDGRTDMETMVAFRDYLTQHGVFATIRASRGEDIFAACGMLSTAKQQKEKGVTL